MPDPDPDPLDTLAALRGPLGRALVEHLTPWDPQRALVAVEAARRDPRWRDHPGLVSAAATQAQLRTRATARFPGPPRWWTPDGLEQATRPVVAARRAARLVASGVTAVVDLGAGAGSDALACAAAGLDVLAVDLDATALAVLAASAEELGLAVTTLRADVTDPEQPWNRGPLAPGTAVFVDPARRRAGRRVLTPQAWSPSWAWVCGLAARSPAAAAKAAPGIDRALIPPDAQAQWVSVGGELVEAAVWWGDLRQGAGHRQATVLRPTADADSGLGADPDADPAVHQLDDAAGVPPPSVGPPGDWLVEPDPSVLRAGLVTVLAGELGARQLHPQIAYLCGDGTAPTTALGTSWIVRDEVPFGRKPLRAWLRRAGFADVVIKKRGVDLVPEELRRDLRLTGPGATATLILTRTPRGPLALRVERAGPAPSGSSSVRTPAPAE